jgi:hypothetical protein
VRGVHPILQAHEAYAAWERAGKALERRQDSLAGQILAAQQAQAAADRDHQAKVREAVEKSRPVPPAPPRADLSHLDVAGAMQREAETAHRAERDRVFAEVAREGGLLAIRDRLRADTERVAAFAPELAAAKADVEATLDLYRDLLLAQDTVASVRVHPTRAERVKVRLTLDELVAADPDALLALTPLQPGQNPILPVDPEEQHRVTMAEHNRLIAEEIKRRETAKPLGLVVAEDRDGVFGNQPRVEGPRVQRLPRGRL